MAIKFTLNDSTFCFVNFHLDKNLSSKMSNITDIHDKLFRQEGVGKRKEESIEAIDYKFLFGDTESNLTLGREKIMDLIKKFEAHKEDTSDGTCQQVIENLLKYRGVSDFKLCTLS